MKTASLCLLVIVAVLTSSCSFRSHAGRHSTGAGVSTPIGSPSVNVRY